MLNLTYKSPGPASLLKTSQVSVWDVLERRRHHLGLRILVIAIIFLDYGLMIGWPQIAVIVGIYIAIQIFEYRGFSRLAALITKRRKSQDIAALCLLGLNSIVFGAPTILLTGHLGSWGAATSAYLLAGTILSAAMTTIGSASSFGVSAMPYFIYICLIVFDTPNISIPLTLPLRAGILIASLFHIHNIWQLWKRWTASRQAEIQAAADYVAERDESERRLFEMTQQDALTGMLNREVLRERLAEAARASTGALLMIDLDGFKYVNDTLGHSAGDIVLREIAGRIRDAAAWDDTAARLGGDEFALLMPNISTAAVALAKAETLIAAVSQPVLLDGHPINIGASIGIVLHPLHGKDAEQLYANADLALYQAKAEGRHCARLYHPDLRTMAQGKVLRDTELQNALERGEFEMFYQPQIRLADGALTGAEALLRWRHPELGLLKPDSFLAALEGGLLSAKVGAWVIETACRQAAVWRENGMPDFRIAVNLFGAQFRCGNLAEWVSQACGHAGLPVDALEIEITENVILRHEDEIIGPLQELRALGVGVAFDDYGTGFASLSMLKRFPVSRLKIDRSFTKDICDSKADAAVTFAVIGLARALNLAVTAEGIETPAQAAALARQGCDDGQGFYFGKPMSHEAFTTQFATRKAAACPRAEATASP